MGGKKEETEEKELIKMDRILEKMRRAGLNVSEHEAKELGIEGVMEKILQAYQVEKKNNSSN
ncbi:hypothetical protein AAXE64_27050 [Priestia megaterium]|uniref:hypothetical protein n=1 Tax=Priestia megaterium TaxID=1404 RepID=UPI003CFFF26C